MNKQFKLSVLAFTILGGLSTYSFAQNADVVNPNQTLNLGQANAFEKEVTPLLREISLKKSLLELRKVERELEKLDEDALKAQVERETLLNQNNDRPTSISGGPMGGITLGSTPTQIGGFNGPSGVPNVPIIMGPNGQIPMGLSGPIANDNAIKILMIYGFSNNLYAKVATGSQGGFVVKQGDVLPDGRLVQNITANYLEVQSASEAKKSKKKSKTERLFVSYTPAPESSSYKGPPPPSNNAASQLPAQNIPVSFPAPMLTPMR